RRVGRAGYGNACAGPLIRPGIARELEVPALDEASACREGTPRDLDGAAGLRLGWSRRERVGLGREEIPGDVAVLPLQADGTVSVRAGKRGVQESVRIVIGDTALPRIVWLRPRAARSRPVVLQES